VAQSRGTLLVSARGPGASQQQFVFRQALLGAGLEGVRGEALRVRGKGAH
jgi:hypothetical protein